MDNLKLSKHEKERVELLREILPQLKDSFVLKDDTALMFGYNLNRYSEDIDLDPLIESTNTIKNKLMNLKFTKFKDVKLQVKKDTQTTFRLMVDYKGKNANLPDEYNDYPLKIECSLRNKFIPINLYKNINGMTIYNIEALINQKITAFSAREKPRDIFDIGFLLEHYNKHFSLENIITLNNILTYKDIEAMELALIEGINMHTLTGIKNIDPAEYVLKIDENVQKRMLYLKRENEKRNNFSR